MKSFPSAFTTAKNSLTGQEPVWIFKFAAGGTTYYLSDNAFSIGPWAVTTKGWVKSWGQQSEGISGTLDEFRIADFNLDIISDPDASPNMESLATMYELEASAVSIYLWFYGCTDPPQEFARGYIKEVNLPDESVVQISFQDESLRLERAMIGTKVDLTVYPKADPDDVGKVIPIPFGSISRLRALAINAGIQTSLPAYLSAVATSFAVSTGTSIVPGMVMQIEDEQILVNSLSGDTITNCTRGVNSTVAMAHDKGSVIWEVRTEFVYAAGDGPVASIPKVYAQVGAVRLDISSVCTVWPAGNHPNYPGLAVISVPGFITIQQAINLALYDGISVTNGTLDASLAGNVTKIGTATLSGAPALTGNVALSGVVSLTGAVGDPGHTHFTGQSGSENTTSQLPTQQSARSDNLYGLGTGSCHLALSFPSSGARSTTTYTITFVPDVTANNVPFYAYVNSQQYYTNTYNFISGSAATITFTVSGDVRVDTVDLVVIWSVFHATAASRTIQLTSLVSSGNSAYVNNGTLSAGNGSLAASNSLSVSNNTLGVADGIGISNTLDPGVVGNVLKTGTVSLTGNSVANTMVGDEILCDVVSLYSSIADVFGNVATRGSFTGTVQTMGTWPAYYRFDGVITEYKSVLYWLNYLAFQCRAWFKLAHGVAQVIYRPNSLSPIKTLASCRISDGKKVHSRRKTVYDEILNTVQILYKRDWSLDKSDTAYTAVAAGSNAVSISNYGARERAELFQFDFVADSTMAADARDFYLWWYGSRHWLHEFDTFLNDSELEFGDAVTLGFAKNEVGQVLETRPAPGDSGKSDTIGLVAVV